MPTDESKKKKKRPEWRIREARGRSVTQLDPVTMHLLHQHGTIPAEELRAIADDVGVGWTKAARTMFIIALSCLILAAVIYSIDIIHGLVTGQASLKSIFSRLTPMSGVWIGPFVIWIGATQVRFKKIRTVMLRHRRCPHCGYDLQGLPTDPDDGTTVCPECGCAWILEAEAGANGDDDGD